MGARVFPKVGAQTGEDTGPNWGSRKEGGVGARGSEGQKIDLNVQNRSGAGSVPGSVAIGLSPGLGGGMKPQKPGEPETLPSSLPSLTQSPPIPIPSPTKFSQTPSSHCRSFLARDIDNDLGAQLGKESHRKRPKSQATPNPSS